MEDPGVFLLNLYRGARELDATEFRDATLKRVRASLDFGSAMWGHGRFAPLYTLAVPTALHTQGLDPLFLVEWAQTVDKDPIVGILAANMGTAFNVRVDSMYANVPEGIAIGKTYGIGSFMVIGTPGLRPRDLQWVSLYSPRKTSPYSERQKRWLEHVVPHLGEASRINHALRQTTALSARVSNGDIAVAEASTGLLIRAEKGFVERLSEEWAGFDGRQLPKVLRSAWAAPGSFLNLGRLCRIDGRRSDELVFLSVRKKALTESLTPRQLEVGSLYALGRSGKQIAQHCGLSPSTVRNHLATVFLSLGVHGKLDMARILEKVIQGQHDPVRDGEDDR